MRTLAYKDLGRMEYLTALAVQEKIVGFKRGNGPPDIVLFVEHPHVYTLGRAGHATHVIEAAGIPVYRTSRGGDVTYHGPGQLVVYPVIDLRSKLRKAVHNYLARLELAAVHTLHDYGLDGARRPPYTGIWIADKKIAAIGIAVSRGITYHGLALNVNTDLSYFERIIPCGLSWAAVTSMAKELGNEPNVDQIKRSFIEHFARLFGYPEIVQEGCSYEDPCEGSLTLVRASGLNSKL